MRKQYSLPTFLGLLVVTIGVAVGVFLVQTRKTVTISASPDEIPKSVKITNISDNSFTVSWVTTKKTLGFIAFGKSDSLGQSIGENTATALHYVTIANLAPSTNYLFKVGSGQNLFDNNGDFYRIKTAPALPTPSKTEVVFGTIVDNSGSPISGIIVYINLAGVSPLSAQTDGKGSWVIPLSSARVSTLLTFANYSGNSNLGILVQGPTQSASAQILVSAARPVPPITLGKTYNFSDVKSPESSSLPSSSVQLAAVETSPTTTPTTKATPTVTTSPTPTAKPVGGTSTFSAQPTKTQPLKALPDAGDLTPTVLLSIMSLCLFVAGFLLAKLT